MALPEPPYLYDDPRLTYDEHCFFYDGGYDDICLTAPTALVIKRTGGGGRNGNSSQRRRKKLEESRPYLNVFIETYLKRLNGEVVDIAEQKHRWTRFSAEDEPLKVFLNGVTLKGKTPYVEGYIKDLVKSQTGSDSLKMSIEFMNKQAEEAEVPEVETNNDIPVTIVEPFSNIKVALDLIPMPTSSLKVESKIIRNKKKGENE